MTWKLSQRFYTIPRKHIAPFKVQKFYDKRAAFHLAANLFNKPNRSTRRAASGKQIIDKNNAIPQLNGIFVYFNASRTVFQIVRDTNSFTRELPFFAHRHKRFVKMFRDGNTKQKAARFKASNNIELHFLKDLVKTIERQLECIGISQDPSNIAEQNSRLRKIRN